MYIVSVYLNRSAFYLFFKEIKSPQVIKKLNCIKRTLLWINNKYILAHFSAIADFISR